jgi:hypothetical protein
MASFTWRALVVGAGLLVVLYLLNLAIPVVMALFFSSSSPRWPGLSCAGCRRDAPPLAVVVAGEHGGGRPVLLGVIVRSIAQEWPSLVAPRAGFGQIEQWLRTGPLQWSDNQINDAVRAPPREGYAATLLSSLGGVFDFITAASVFLFATFFFLPTATAVGVGAGGSPSAYDAKPTTPGSWAGRRCRGTPAASSWWPSPTASCFIGLEILGIPLAPVLAVVVFFARSSR